VRIKSNPSSQECPKTGKSVGNLEAAGNHPDDSFSFSHWHGLCLIQAMKTVVSKVKRSGVYYLITSIASVDDSRNTRRDTWGIVGVVALLLGVAGLMRLLLSL
jgi:hypothetical protein